MSIESWNLVAPDLDEQVFEVAAHDLNGIIVEQVRKLAKNATTAADLGCGAGSLLPSLCSKFKKVYAVDYADELLKVAKKKNDFTNIKYICHNLAGTKPLSFSADVTFSINVLISKNHAHRQAMVQSLWRVTRRNGYCVVVVPSMESISHIYQTLVRCSMREDKSHRKAVNDVNRLYKKEVISPIEGIVSIGGIPTKCYTREEIAIVLSEAGFSIDEILRVEFPWSEEIEHAPHWLKGPYPWDWLVLARKI